MLEIMIFGASAYLVAGTLSLVFPKFKFWLSLGAWFFALYGLGRAGQLFRQSGPQVRFLGPWEELGIGVTVDAPALIFASLVVILHFFTLLYLGNSRGGKFYCLYNLLLGATFSLAFSNDLFNLYVTLELMSLVSILLIGWERKTYQMYAGVKYLLFSAFAMSLYLVGLGMLYQSAGYLGIDKLARVVGDNPGLGVSVALGLMTTGLAAKGGVLLFSMWLPDAYAYSSTVVSTLLSGISVKCGLLGIIRLSRIAAWNPMLIALGLVTGLGGVIYAILEDRPKKILAYSTLSQVGYVLLGLGTGTFMGITAASLYLLFHGLFKSLLFLSVGHAGVGGTPLWPYDGGKLPLASWAGLAMGSMALAALPPFSGFLAKGLLMKATPQIWVSVSILTIGVGTALYLIKLNWALLRGGFQNSYRGRNLVLLAYACIVGLSAFFPILFVEKKTLLNLFSLNHLLESLGVLLLASFFYWGLKDLLRRITVPAYLFDLDNSLLFLTTGSILILFFVIMF
ncbi:MAG: complex I subunit 5 family protein [Candidatus Acetothermia bacterium]